GIDLENIVYYKDDTHYFVMTAKKQSLLKMGVILQDKPDTESLLAPDNVNREALLNYAKEAANFSTNYCLPQLEFARNHRDEPDVDMFDFTCMTRSENAALVREQHGARLLLGLVGDCLVEVRNRPHHPPCLSFPSEKEAGSCFDHIQPNPWEIIYQLLSQTSPDNTSKNVSQYSIDPATRYPNVNLNAIKPSQVPPASLSGGCGNEPVPPTPILGAGPSPGPARELGTPGCWGHQGAGDTGSVSSGTRVSPWDFDSLDALEPVQRHQKLLDAAEQELGIQPVLSSAEMASMTEADRLGLITYLSQFYEAFKPSPGSEDVAAKSLSSRGTKGAILFLSKLQKSRNMTLKRAQDGAQKDAEPKRSRREAEMDLGPNGDVWDGGHEQPPADPGQVGPICPRVQQVRPCQALGGVGAEPRAGIWAAPSNTHEPGTPPSAFPDPTGFPEQSGAAPSAVPAGPSRALGAGGGSRSGGWWGQRLCFRLQVPVLEGSEKFATWTRLLPRQAREAQMQRVGASAALVPQAIQRRLEEIEVTFGELEKQGIKLEKFLRDESASPAELRTQWMNQLLYLVQKKKSLVSEESDLMIAVQELKLEEQQSRLDQQLRRFMSKEDAQKTPAERAAEQETLAQLLEVVNQRNALIHVQEERR
ncbi:Protein-methionine sulfoxide oxidase MICAL3, partial [Tinamus guttatus]